MTTRTTGSVYRIGAAAYLLIATALLGWPLLAIAKLVQLSL